MQVVISQATGKWHHANRVGRDCICGLYEGLRSQAISHSVLEGIVCQQKRELDSRIYFRRQQHERTASSMVVESS
jgi:hypothetical protein